MWYDTPSVEVLSQLHLETMESVKQLRGRLAVGADGKDTKALQEILHDIARGEAEAEILFTARALLSKEGTTGKDVWAYLLESVIARGADDDWSGRGNDLRRVIFDAKRQTVTDLKYGLEKL